MGILNKIFGSNETSSDEKKVIPWNQLNSINQLDQILEESKSKPIAIFKHSTRCGISRMVINQFESNYTIEAENLKLYYLDLLNFRDISNEIGYKFQVMHQSPQLIVIKNTETVAHASHYEINSINLEQFI
ncbi:MAG: bacillithiol system redox-active protein YtxJ [Flavobacteriaceae bacterium]|nr:bacillithiol system redox-active protein YtxJ [Flavobacteriaceae bacterium]